jgi:hypothetical protein
MPPPEMWQCFKTLRRRRAGLTLGVANKSQSSVNVAFCDGYHIVSATAALSGVESVSGALIPNISGSMGSDREKISRSNVFSLLSANRRLLERLEAENAQLRASVADLSLQIQALREALGHPQSEIRPK